MLFNIPSPSASINPALCTFTLVATGHATLLASFTLAKVFFKAFDAGLETNGVLLKLVLGVKVVAVMEGVKRVRVKVTIGWKEGARGMEPSRWPP